jgi:hypothetical protein
MSDDSCRFCAKPIRVHSLRDLQRCLKQGDLEHIRKTGKPIIETVNGETRVVDEQHPSPLWGDESITPPEG